jgi:hypothetical protein
VQGWLRLARKLSATNDRSDGESARREALRSDFFAASSRRPSVLPLAREAVDKLGDLATGNAAGASVPFNGDASGFLRLLFADELPAETDEFALEFLAQCHYNVERATLVLTSILGGGHEVSALRHIQGAKVAMWTKQQQVSFPL